jgi:hypothetical protein
LYGIRDSDHVSGTQALAEFHQPAGNHDLAQRQDPGRVHLRFRCGPGFVMLDQIEFGPFGWGEARDRPGRFPGSGEDRIRVRHAAVGDISDQPQLDPRMEALPVHERAMSQAQPSGPGDLADGAAQEARRAEAREQHGDSMVPGRQVVGILIDDPVAADRLCDKGRQDEVYL